MIDTDFWVQNALIPFSSALAGNAGGKFLAPVARVLDNWFYIKFGSKSELERKKTELKNEKLLEIYETELEKQQNIGIFKNEIVKRVRKIPEDKIIIPNKNTLALVMEKAEYFIDIEELRNAYAQIIASSCNVEYQDSIHPTMVDTIQKLTPCEFKSINTLTTSAGFCFSILPYFTSGLAKTFNIALENSFPKLFGYLNREQLNVIYTDEEQINEKLIIIENEIDKSLSVLRELGIIEQFIYGKEYKVSAPLFDGIEKNIKIELNQVQILRSITKSYYHTRKILSFILKFNVVRLHHMEN